MIANARMYAIGGAAARRTPLEGSSPVPASPATSSTIRRRSRSLHCGPGRTWLRVHVRLSFLDDRTAADASAAPVPNPAPHGGRPSTDRHRRRRGSRLERLEDTFGTTFAGPARIRNWWHAPRLRRAPHAQRRGGPLFAATIGPLVTPRAVAVAVAEGRADAGPLDCYAHALLRTHEPALAARLRVIAQTPAVPIPPLVGAPAMAPGDASRLRAVLVDATGSPDRRARGVVARPLLPRRAGAIRPARRGRAARRCHGISPNRIALRAAH
jgi:hypothetical protein